jgi:hypothetical protein
MTHQHDKPGAPGQTRAAAKCGLQYSRTVRAQHGDSAKSDWGIHVARRLCGSGWERDAAETFISNVLECSLTPSSSMKCEELKWITQGKDEGKTVVNSVGRHTF